MATQWISPTWRMPENSNQSKFDNYSLDFDGGSQSINCGNVAALISSSSFTISGWFTQTTLNQYRILFGTRNGSTDTVNIYTFTDGNMYVEVKNGSSSYGYFDYSTVISADTWFHLAMVFDGSGAANADKLKLYINNSEVTLTYSGTLPSSTSSSALDFKLGIVQGLSAEWLGKMAQVAVFETSLTSAQITALYNSGTPVNPMALTPLPTAYYPLGGSSTGDAADPATTLTVPNDAVPSATVFDFDNSDNDVVNTSYDIVSGNKSISFWFNSSYAGYQSILGDSTDGFVLGHFTSQLPTPNGISYTDQDTGKKFGITGSVTDEFADGNWHNFVYTYDGNSKIYIDGTERTISYRSGTTSSDDIVIIDNLGLGLNLTGYPKYTGKLSNVQAWNTDLSSAEVTTLYNNGVPYTGTQPQAANLKGWWKMNVDTSTWDGTNWTIGNSTANYTTALDFDGSNDYIQIPYNANLTPQTGNFTISAWINTDDLSGWHPIWSTLNLDSSVAAVALHTFDTKIRVTIGRPTSGWALLLDSTQALSTSTWYHIAVTFDFSGNAQIYINGSADNSGAIGTHSTTWNTGDRYIGEGEGLWNGRVSNLSIYNSVLTSAQVQTLYNSGTPETTISLSPVSWWKLDNVTTGIQDSAGSNNGTNNGATQVNTFVSTVNGTSSGMNTANLVNSDLTRSIPYSSYSMAFDGTASADYIDFGSGILGDESNLSISFWLKPNVVNDNDGVFTISTMVSSQNPLTFFLGSSNLKLYINSAYAWQQDFSSKADTWTHVLLSYDSATAANSKVYINGVEDAGDGTYNFATGNIDASGAGIKVIIGSYYTSAYSLDGEMSNVAVWNSSLSADQALTIYNGGVPNDISSLSPTGWWSLAGDSYYNGTDWICPDLSSSSNNGTSFNMPATALIGDGPGSTANGIATSMDIPANLKGNAPNSSNNAFSVNMNSADRVTSVPG